MHSNELLPTFQHLGQVLATPPVPRIWRNSTAYPVQYKAISRRESTRSWHEARRWDRQTRQHGRHGGALGRVALAVYYSLLNDFHNYRTGQTNPSLETLGKAAGVSKRSVSTALAILRNRGLVTWARRCTQTLDNVGRSILRQLTNAYEFKPRALWRGYLSQDPPTLDDDQLGRPERIREPLEAALAAALAGHREEIAHHLASDESDQLSLALARLGRTMGAI